MNTGETILDIKLFDEDIERLTSLYLISNTPAFLYAKFRNDSFIQLLASKYSTTELVNEFVVRGERGIKSTEELAIEYAIFIAITLKEHADVKSFFETKGNINFEWFHDIKLIYLSSYVPFSISDIDMLNKGIIIESDPDRSLIEDDSVQILNA